MESTSHLSNTSSICKLCRSILWFQLQPEDIPASPHHKSRRALEQSARTCRLCGMVLRAAISNYRDSRGLRHRRGYWKVFHSIRIQEAPGTIRDVTYAIHMGSSLPVGESPLWNAGRPVVIPALLPGGNWNAWRHVVAPTGTFDANYDHIAREEALPDMGSLDLNEPADDMPVWLYGNWWGAGPPQGDGDSSHLRFMGIGARFGRSHHIFDACNTEDGKAHLRGSAIRVCTTDGMCFINNFCFLEDECLSRSRQPLYETCPRTVERNVVRLGSCLSSD
jgi:hypothetical protein